MTTNSSALLLLLGDISTATLTRKDKSTWPLFAICTATAIEYNRIMKCVNLKVMDQEDAIIIRTVNPQQLGRIDWKRIRTRCNTSFEKPLNDAMFQFVREAPQKTINTLLAEKKTEDIIFYYIRLIL